MKSYLLITVFVLLFSCGKNADNDESNIELIKFKGTKFTIGYPNTWYLNTEEMNNTSSPSLITANRKIASKRFLTFQLINLIDTACLETGVKNFMAKSIDKSQTYELEKIKVNNSIFLITRIKYKQNIFSENFFLKNNDNLFWFTFMGKEVDIDNYNREIYSIIKSFALNDKK